MSIYEKDFTYKVTMGGGILYKAIDLDKTHEIHLTLKNTIFR